MNASPFFKLEIFIPEENVEELMEALAAVHAGEIGKYDHCFAVTSVTSFFQPLEGADPYIGQIGQMTSMGECKLEVNVREDKLAETIEEVRRVHPYEEPLINVYPLANARYGGTM